MSTPSSPVSDHSFEVTPSDPVDHGAKRKSKKPPRSPKQPKGQDEEDSEHKRRTYFGIFKRSSKKQRKSFVVVPTGAPRRISASKDSEDKLKAEDFTNAQPSAEDMTEGDAPQQDEVRDHGAEESATDETLILP